MTQMHPPLFSVSETLVGPTIRSADCQEECEHFFFFFFFFIPSAISVLNSQAT